MGNFTKSLNKEDMDLHGKHAVEEGIWHWCRYLHFSTHYSSNLDYQILFQHLRAVTLQVGLLHCKKNKARPSCEWLKLSQLKLSQSKKSRQFVHVNNAKFDRLVIFFISFIVVIEQVVKQTAQHLCLQAPDLAFGLCKNSLTQKVFL